MQARWLSARERQRAARFRFEHLREHYRRSQCGLRQLLGRRLGIDPGAVQFEIGPKGKPHLAALHRSTLHFNLSHSNGSAWIAMADVPVGIDLERLADRAMQDRAALSARVCSADEQAVLQALPEALRTRAFLLAWTRKEALLKAWGVGITGLDSLQSLDTRLPAATRLLGLLHDASLLPTPLGIDTMPHLAAETIDHPAMPRSNDTGAPAPTRQEHPRLWLRSFCQGDEIVSLAATQPFSLAVAATTDHKRSTSCHTPTSPTRAQRRHE